VKSTLAIVHGFFLSALSFAWRRLMSRTTFLAVTGSLGKSTTTRTIATVLSSRFSTNLTRDGQNSRVGLARSILQTRTHHEFSILEIGTKRPGALWRAAWQVRPDAVVILNVARCHTDRYPTLDHIAAEKAQLLSRLGPNDLAILNGDDPRVRAMASRCRGRVVTFGQSSEFDVWASDVNSQWPSRLSFVAHAGGESHAVRTQLVGEHWLTGALASLAVALSYGISLKRAAAAMERCEPFTARMQPVLLPMGITILRDDFLPSMDACNAALRVMRSARARRRLLAISDVEDSAEPPAQRLANLGASAAQSVDFAVFFGEDAETAAAAARGAGMRQDCVRAFPTQNEAGAFLRSELREGDLLLLRASLTDHGERIYWAQYGTVGCSRLTCSRLHLCDVCPELHPGLERTRALAPEWHPVWRPNGKAVAPLL
jgi:UDP-N-acetylmuramoyl-tripeptide--D-alanyl-D-alanine ligase